MTTPGGTTTHECPGCGMPGVPRHQLACKPCWFRLPTEVRRFVGDSYRVRFGREADHRRAVAIALAWYREHPVSS